MEGGAGGVSATREGAPPQSGRAPSGWPLLASELSVLFRRRRTWAMLLALAAVPVLMALAVRVSSSVPPGRGPAFLDRITQNGLFVGVTALLVCVPLFLPLTVGVVAGDTIAGEAGLGTLRYLLWMAALLTPRPPAAFGCCWSSTPVPRRFASSPRWWWHWQERASVRHCFRWGP